MQWKMKVHKKRLQTKQSSKTRSSCSDEHKEFRLLEFVRHDDVNVVSKQQWFCRNEERKELIMTKHLLKLHYVYQISCATET